MEIRLETSIRAPILRCFDLARSIDLHLHSASGTAEQVIGGKTSGLICGEEEVEWKARHFGVRLRMRSRVTVVEAPTYFQDRMVDGPFHSFVHDHRFESQGSTTLMVDILKFDSAVPLLGAILDFLIVGPHLRRFLATRNAHLKAVAESVEWHRYLADNPQYN